MKRILSGILSVMLLLGIVMFQTSVQAEAAGMEIREVSGETLPQKITITGSRYVARGKKILLQAAVAPAGANQQVVWKSADRKIATVTSKGTVKGIRPGKVKIIAASKTDPNVKRVFTVEVKKYAVTRVTVTGQKTLTLGDRSTVTLKAKALPAKAAQAFTWKSSNPKVAVVSAKGKVTAKAVGTVTITATAADGSGKKASVKITVRKGSEGAALLRTLSGYSFIMSSGAGGWSDTMKISASGTFTGSYRDSDMGDTGSGYPDGTVYVGTYSGKLGNIRKLNKYLYRATVLRKVMDKRPKAQIIDGTRYLAVEGGFPAGAEVFICVPGTPLSKIPEDAWMWFMGITGDFTMTKTPYYGIYMKDGSHGFINYH